MRLASYLRFCAILALVVLASAQPRTRREREEEQAAAAAAAAAPTMQWAKPDAPPAKSKPAAAPPAPAAAAAAAKPAKDAPKDAPKGAVKGFIRVSGNKFVDEKCGDFIPIGWNCKLDEFEGGGGGRKRALNRWQRHQNGPG